jgi:hypothetical protein
MTVVMQRYLVAGACYGFVRKSLDIFFNAREVTIERRLMELDGKLAFVSRNRPMLMTEKIAVIAMHTCICAPYSPYRPAEKAGSRPETTGSGREKNGQRTREVR